MGFCFKNRIMNEENLSNDFERQLREWEEQERKKEKAEKEKKRLQDIGHLGGRPRLEKSRTSTIGISVTADEKSKIQAKADAAGLTLSSFCRTAALEQNLPDGERNRILMEYRSNFKRISNWFKSATWTMDEKIEYIKMLKETINGIEKEIKK